MASSLEDKTAVDLYGSAVEHGLEELVVACREFVGQHAHKALAGKLVCKLSQDAFVGLLRSEALNIREIDAFEAVVRGRNGKKQCAEGTRGATGGAHHIRFGIMTGEELADTAMPSELVNAAVTADAMSAHLSKRAKPTGIRHRRCSSVAQQGVELLFLAQANEAGNAARAKVERSGLLWHLGSAGRAQEYACLTSVAPSWSRLGMGEAETIVGLLDAPVYARSNNPVGSWCEVDLGEFSSDAAQPLRAEARLRRSHPSLAELAAGGAQRRVRGMDRTAHASRRRQH